MEFSRFGRKSVLAAFDGGEITSDAGVLLLREAARRMNLFSRMAGCFTDERAPERIRHPLPELLAQRVSAIALGYEDLNDHDSLRFDPALRLLGRPDNGALAASATLGRLEHSAGNSDRRYHKFAPSLKDLSALLTDIFIESHQVPPERIILDIDATDIEVHGRQENSFFNGYYEHRCFLPLYVFCGPHLLLAQLRPGNVDGARGARNVIRRIINRIRQSWPNVRILVRGDAGFLRENLLRWCEANAVDYICGLARNDYLLRKAQKTRGHAARDMIRAGKTITRFGAFTHCPRTRTWAKPRQVIVKVRHKPGEDKHCRFLVTSIDHSSRWTAEAMRKGNHEGKQAVPEAIHDSIYCPRGDMENRIKDCQLDLFGNRANHHDYRANQLRLILAGFAYLLMTRLRLTALAGTALARAAPNTIRLKLLRIGARVLTSVRRIRIAMPDAYPQKPIFFEAWKALCAPT